MPQTIHRGFPPRLAESLSAIAEPAASRAIETLVSSVDDHDTYGGGHSHRVADYVTNLARLMGSSREEVEFIRQVGMVHDIGKIGIPDGILRKRGPLTDEEVHLVRLHPVLGASILSRMKGLERMVPIVLHHHERWDGEGYPSGKSGVEIPFSSRLIFIAESFDAMTSVGPYGRVLTPEQALAELRLHSGKQFDPLLVDAMHNAYRHGLLDNTPGSIYLSPSSSWTVSF